MDKHVLWIRLTGLAILAVMLIIFLFSAQSGDASTQVSSGLLNELLDTLPATPGDLDQTAFEAMEWNLRKAGHFIEFFTLGFLLCWHLSLTRRQRPWLWALLLGIAYAATDELHQLFVPGRSAAVLDVGRDALGVLAGTAVLMLLRRIHRRMHPEKG